MNDKKVSELLSELNDAVKYLWVNDRYSKGFDLVKQFVSEPLKDTGLKCTGSYIMSNSNANDVLFICKHDFQAEKPMTIRTQDPKGIFKNVTIEPVVDNYTDQTTISEYINLINLARVRQEIVYCQERISQCQVKLTEEEEQMKDLVRKEQSFNKSEIK